MTTRLYYAEPYRSTFQATVTACARVHGRVEVRLDQTAFYPASGGQPCDTGLLGGVRVCEVVDADDGGIVHVVAEPLAAGAVVEGEIDWARRFDHMQQHTGQHVLSAAFDRLCGARTDSFHLGDTAATIDLARVVTPAEIAGSEDEANRIVWEDRAVDIRVASAEEAVNLPLRKEAIRSGPLRLIEIGGFDLSACGGTHVARTGSVGLIAVAGWEKMRGGTRVEFLCGGRALARFRTWRAALADCQRHLSVSPTDLAAGIAKLLAEHKGLQRSARGLQERLATHEARGLVARGHRSGARVIVSDAVDDWDAAGLKALAMAAAQAEPAAAVALFTRPSPARVVVSAGCEAGIDASAVVRALIGRFGGKGGGSHDLAQGGGLSAPAAELTAEASRLLRE